MSELQPSWLSTPAAGVGVPGLAPPLNLVPDLAQGYEVFLSSLKGVEGVPLRLLELGRVRIALIHDCQPQLDVAHALAPLTPADRAALERIELSAFDAAEQATLAIAEKIPLAHHDITDAEVEALKAPLGERPAMAVIVALSFFDVQCRLSQTLRAPEPSDRES
ncbi:MAG: hypothetical protein AAGI15_08680 [Pseudomonadota bacterium]